MPAEATTKKPVIGITLGDPAGIGPEVIAKALQESEIRIQAEILLIGDGLIFKKFSFPKAPGCEFLDLKTLPHDVQPGRPCPESAKAALLYLKKSIDLVKERKIQAIVTGPLSKEAISQVLGNTFHGHTEFLAESFDVKKFEMMFVGGGLKTVVVTRHIPLRDVPEAITTEKVLSTIILTNDSLKKLFKITRPKIAVCGLNPHAGEGGKMGREEIEKIGPAILRAQKQGIDASGPFPSDTIFSRGIREQYDVTIAMYHDQGIIPVKSLAFAELVNMTIGLPFVRTSPAHGTAFAIAGKNVADPHSMMAAINLAVQLVS